MDTNRITTADAGQDMGKLIQEAFHDLEKLATQHIKLFQSEMKQDMNKATQGIISLIVGLNTCFVGGVMLAITLALGLEAAFPQLPWWATFGIVALVVLGGGVAFLLAAWQRFNAATPIAEKTQEVLQEDAKWLTNPK
jgi:cation transport ATPase